MFFPQIFCAVGSSSLVISVKLEVGPGKAHRKISSFSSFCRENHKLIDSIFFIVRDQFSAMIKKESNTKECKKRGASKESIACKGFNH